MLEQARGKARGLAASAGFELGDLRNLRLDRRFDAVLILFAVLGYQTKNADVVAALRTARAHLRPGGLVFFDVWYGPAVLRNRPTDRFRVIDTARGRVLRLSRGTLDTRHHRCDVDVRLWVMKADRIVAESEERHVVRFFFPLELELLLETSGLSLVRLGAFPDFDREPDETTWNVLAVAQSTQQGSN